MSSNWWACTGELGIQVGWGNRQGYFDEFETRVFRVLRW